MYNNTVSTWWTLEDSSVISNQWDVPDITVTFCFECSTGWAVSPSQCLIFLFQLYLKWKTTVCQNKSAQRGRKWLLVRSGTVTLPSSGHAHGSCTYFSQSCHSCILHVRSGTVSETETHPSWNTNTTEQSQNHPLTSPWHSMTRQMNTGDCSYVPHSSDPSLLKEQLHSYFTPLWIQSSVECPVVHHGVEPLDRLLRPTDPVHRHHLRGFAQAGNMW